MIKSVTAKRFKGKLFHTQVTSDVYAAFHAEGLMYCVKCAEEYSGLHHLAVNFVKTFSQTMCVCVLKSATAKKRNVTLFFFFVFLSSS